MYRLLQFICYDNNEDIRTKHKVKDLPLWHEKNYYMYCISSFHNKIHDYRKRSMAVFKYLDLQLYWVPYTCLLFRRWFKRNSS